VIDCVRVACYISQVPGALDMIKGRPRQGLRNHAQPDGHFQGPGPRAGGSAGSAAKSRWIRFTWSTAMARSTPNRFTTWCWASWRPLDGTGKHVGIHAHNNMQLAYANTVERSSWAPIDSTPPLLGWGARAGNCALGCCCRSSRTPSPPCARHRVHRKHFVPLAKEPGLGYSIPYLIHRHAQ